MELVELYPQVWQAFLLSLVVALLATPIAIRMARSVGAIDDPSDERRIHKIPTPRLGGLAILASILVSVLVLGDWSYETARQQVATEQMLIIMVCAIAIAALGAIDDTRGLGWKSKLGGQLSVALAAVFLPLFGRVESVKGLLLPVRIIDPPLVSAITISPWVGALIAIVAIVALMNMMNFVDGVDGLAAGLAAISAGTFAIIAASYGRADVAVLAAATSGASIGFLRHNFRRGGADIFMGDAGSMLLGFLLAVISLQGVLKTAAAVSLVIPLALLAIPIFDTMFVVAKRVKYGQSLASADRWHLHHRLLNVGFSPRRVTIVFWLWTMSLSAVALALRFVNYGNSNNWNSVGLAKLSLVLTVAIALSIYLAIVLEIIKTRTVRNRNAQIASEVADQNSSGPAST